MTADAIVLIFGLACSLWVGMYLLAFSVVFPAAWSKMVDQVHEYFLRRRLISGRVSDTIKVLEKGFVVRLAMTTFILVTTVDLTVCVMRYVFGLRI